MFTCPMHPEIRSDQPGTCPKCGMTLVPVPMKMDHEPGHEHGHETHSMMPVTEMSWLEKFRMSMTMSMGMDHTGVAGREMAKLMEEDIRQKVFFALMLSIPIIAYS